MSLFYNASQAPCSFAGFYRARTEKKTLFILGVITNGLSDAQAKKRQRLGLNDWFDCFVVSDEVGIAKPNKEIFEMAVDNIANKRNHPLNSYNKRSMLMVGDSLISDGYGAQNFGINYCHINNNFGETNPAETAITYHIKSVAELPGCICYTKEYELFLNNI